MHDKNGHQFYSDVAESVILKCGEDIFWPGRDLFFFLFATFSAIEIRQRFTVFTIWPHWWFIYLMSHSKSLLSEEIPCGFPWSWSSILSSGYQIPRGYHRMGKPLNPILFPSPVTHKNSLQKITLKNYQKNTAPPPPNKTQNASNLRKPPSNKSTKRDDFGFFAAKKPPRNPWPPKGARLVKRGQCPKRQNSPWRISKVVLALNQGLTPSVWIVGPRVFPSQIYLVLIRWLVVLIEQRNGTFPKGVQWSVKVYKLRGDFNPS